MSLSMPGLCALSRRLASAADAPGPDAARSRGLRRAQGAFFTPAALVAFVVEQTLDRRFARGDIVWHAEGYPGLRILDPAAGDGRFLLEATESLLRRGKRLGHHCDAEKIRRHCLVAMERDLDYAAIARKTLEGATVHCSEALLSQTVADGSVDVVLGNPPYLRSVALGRADASLRHRLRSHYTATSHGEWDLYAAFLEQGLRWLGENGELGMVVPSRWWTARWAGPLRAALADRGAVHALVDFGATQIFSDATVYASLCFASATSHAQVQVARACGTRWELGDVPTAQLRGTGAWDLSVGTSRQIVEQLRGQGAALGEVARIAKGTGTNADSIFVLQGEHGGIESALLHAVLRGRDVRALGAVPPWPRLLVPYDEEGRLIPSAQMQREYPRAFAYLAEHRAPLEARERGRFAGEHFYCFGRPQNLRFLRDPSPKVVIPDVTREGRALLDDRGAMVLDSAYAIRLGPDAEIDLPTLCGLLNSRLVRLWLDSQGLPLRGGYTRMKTAYLRGLPLPSGSPATHEIGALVRASAPLSAIDEQVRCAYGLSVDRWNHGCAEPREKLCQEAPQKLHKSEL